MMMMIVVYLISDETFLQVAYFLIRKWLLLLLCDVNSKNKTGMNYISWCFCYSAQFLTWAIRVDSAGTGRSPEGRRAFINTQHYSTGGEMNVNTTHGSALMDLSLVEDIAASSTIMVRVMTLEVHTSAEKEINLYLNQRRNDRNLFTILTITFQRSLSVWFIFSLSSVWRSIGHLITVSLLPILQSYL